MIASGGVVSRGAVQILASAVGVGVFKVGEGGMNTWKL